MTRRYLRKGEVAIGADELTALRHLEEVVREEVADADRRVFEEEPDAFPGLREALFALDKARDAAKEMP